MASMNIQVNDTVMRMRFDKLTKTINSAMLMERIAAFAWTRIKRRTKKGVDADGKAFDGYSEKYKKKRAAKGLRVNIVDLYDSGDMYGSGRQEIGSLRAKLFFAHEGAARAAGHTLGYASGGLPVRNFFALGVRDEDALTKYIIKQLDGI